MAYKLDAIDKRILFELDKNARIPDTQLAKLVRKSKESVRYRINKLKEENIILDFTVWINPVKTGYQTAKIYFSLANIPEKIYRPCKTRQAVILARYGRRCLECWSYLFCKIKRGIL